MFHNIWKIVLFAKQSQNKIFDPSCLGQEYGMLARISLSGSSQASRAEKKKKKQNPIESHLHLFQRRFYDFQ